MKQTHNTYISDKKVCKLLILQALLVHSEHVTLNDLEVESLDGITQT